MTVSQRLSYELFEPEHSETDGEQKFYRLFEFFLMANVIKLSWQWGFYMLHNSDVVLSLGIANYINITFLFHHFLSLINAGLITLIVIISFFRIGFSWQYAVAMLLLHLQFAGRYSQGEIPHSANLIGLSLLCFSIGFIIFDERLKRNRFIFGCIIFFTGLGYTSAAFTKLIGTGFNWSDGNHLWLWLAEKKTDILSRTGSFHYNWLQKIAFSSHLVATLILSIGWFTEFCGFLIWWKRFRPYVTTAIIVMHIGITITMNIRFDTFIYELIFIGYPWTSFINKYISYIPTGLNLKN